MKIEQRPAQEMALIAAIVEIFGNSPPDIIMQLNGLEPQAINLMDGYPNLIPNL